ncbi:MAG: DGQHR domain-containing protein [Acidobacteria bacterium]|nr:DGQHR domain-containing protein [Acidobacteriota bacterium]
MPQSTLFTAFEYQQTPSKIVVASIPGDWLLDHVVPSLRKEDTEKGFQRLVNLSRTKAIADSVIKQGRSFPNAVVLATKSNSYNIKNGSLALSDKASFLVVDGQHRLYSQRHSDIIQNYVCMIHFGLDERKMAELFIEINNNQKRVPSSLRWDLMRLVRSDDDPYEALTSDLIFELNMTEDSPLFLCIDLTGENKNLTLSQGSISPEIHKLVKSKKSPLHELSFEVQALCFKRYFTAMKECDPDGWRAGTSNLYRNRVIRALLIVLPRIIQTISKSVESISALDYLAYLGKIPLDDLSDQKIKDKQGSAGIRDIVEWLTPTLGV